MVTFGVPLIVCLLIVVDIIRLLPKLLTTQLQKTVKPATRQSKVLQLGNVELVCYSVFQQLLAPYRGQLRALLVQLNSHVRALSVGNQIVDISESDQYLVDLTP